MYSEVLPWFLILCATETLCLLDYVFIGNIIKCVNRLSSLYLSHSIFHFIEKLRTEADMGCFCPNYLYEYYSLNNNEQIFFCYINDLHIFWNM